MVIAASLAEKTGDKIGRYKLLQQIGEGGCGVVYMADQEEPVKRRVALKVIKAGMDTREVLGRFEAERQAMALMDHPNIAKVLDAGATKTGRPFFVMELVRGMPITHYCDETKANTRKRLELFIQVCQAIQHAHQKGIIHRDIKPSNILVAEHDGVPVPVVIDFGIAKATSGQTLTDKTVFTALEQFIGTPAYMSPEQANLTGLDIDTRSDIYSLGVLLYELLTGRTPFDSRRLFEAGFDEIRRIIREEEPLRPSRKLSTLSAGEQTTTALFRQTDSPRLIHLVRGDLDWIAMKCLEKDRNRRYETASGLAADLDRHLKNEPVAARPPSQVYRLQKAWRRNKTAFTAAALVAVVLVAATGISVWQAVLARQRLADSEAISKFLTEVFRSPDPAKDSRTITVVETLAAAAKKLETDLSNQPARRAKLQATIALTYYMLGLYRDAIPLQEKARDYYLSVSGLKNPDTLAAMHQLANCYDYAGRRDEALKLREEVLTLRRKVSGQEDPDTLRAINNLANSYDEVGRRDEALKLREEVLALDRKVRGTEQTETLLAMENLAVSYLRAGRLPDAVRLFEEVLSVRRKVNGPEHPSTLQAMNNLAISYDEAGRKPEALKLREEELPISRKVNGPENPDTLSAMNNLAISYYYAGRKDETLKLREEVLALRRKALGPEHAETLRAMNNLADSYSEAGRRDDALKLRQEALAQRRKSAEQGQLDELNAVAWELATSHDACLRDGAAAVNFAEKAAAATKRMDPGVLDTLAAAYAEAGQYDKAAATLTEAIGLLKDSATKKDFGSRLTLYQSNTPYRQP